jgi:AraC-like DNA-binding protein
MHKPPQTLHETPAGAPRLYNAGSHEAPAGRGHGLHQHTCWELVYYRVGQVGCPLGNEFYQSRPGMLLVTPPSTVHGELAGTAYSCFYIGIEAPRHLAWPHMCLDDVDSTFEHLCKALIREWTGQHADRDEMLALLVRRLDISLRRCYESPRLSQGERMVQEVERLFYERLARSFTIKDIAAELDVSLTVLRGHFAQRRGQAPLARLHAIRIEHALILLRTSDHTLEAIAELCGFHSASHLSRYVKRATSKSPGQLRGSSRQLVDGIAEGPVHHTLEQPRHRDEPPVPD